MPKFFFKFISGALILLAFIRGSVVLAQDKHFSQFHSSPLQLNPALTGLINGSYRVNLNYRNQWSKIIGNNFQTIAASGDMNIKSPVKAWNKDLLGIGLSFFSDKVAGYDLNNTEVALQSAYHKSTGANQFLSLGVKLGIFQRGINYENLRFEDQYVEGQGYTRTSLEILPENNLSMMELALGLDYTLTGKKNQGLGIGVSVHHITSPDFSFFNLSPALVEPAKQPLYGIFSFHLSGSLALTEDQSILPRIWYIQQGPHKLFTLGTLFKTPLDPDNIKSLHAGGFLRIVNGEKSMALESFIPMIGFELGNVNIGLSYDANLRRLAPSYFQQSIFELSLSILGNYDNQSFFCPKF
jgi:type IX secretion system PorP/SprF family membrane protein